MCKLGLKTASRQVISFCLSCKFAKDVQGEYFYGSCNIIVVLTVKEYYHQSSQLLLFKRNNSFKYRTTTSRNTTNYIKKLKLKF